MRAGTRRIVLWVALAAILATIGIAAHQHYRVSVKLADPLGGHINDFDRWMLMTPRFLHDRADYVNDLLPTAPLTLLVLAPFTALSRPMAMFVWVCVKLPLACLVLALSIGLVRRSGARLTPSALALIVACWWLPVVIDMQEGQMNLLALLPLVAGLYAAQQETRWGDAAAGLLIGLAISVKVTPVIFAAYFLWKRRWVISVAAAASVAIWLLLVPAMVFGWDQNIRWLGQWAHIMITPYVAGGKVVYATSQSFGSFALRLLSANPAFETNGTLGVEPHYMNVVALSNHMVYQVVRAVMIGVAAVGLFWTRHPLPTLRSQRYLFELAAVAAFMLWFSERTWVHHYVSFVLTLAAAGAVLSDATHPERTHRRVKAALIAFSIVTVFASEAGRVFGPDGVDWAKALGVFLWPSVVVTLATMWPALGAPALARREYAAPDGSSAAAARPS